jgi:hypothetical protein
MTKKKEDDVVFEDDSLDNVPDFVKKQAEDANKLLNPDPEEPVEPVVPDPEIVPDPVADPEPEPGIIPPAEPVIDPVDVVDEGTFEHKYNTLKGKYNSEMEGLRGEIENQRKMIEHFMAAPPVAIADPADPEPVKKGSLDPNDYEDLEHFMVEAGKRIGSLEDVNTDLTGKLKKSEEKLSNFERGSVESAQTTFEGELTKAIPDWEVINDRADWKVWLLDQEYHQQWGIRRQDMVANAQRTGNPQPIINLLKEWKQTKVKPKPVRELSDEVIPADDTVIDNKEKVITREIFNAAKDKAAKGKITTEEFTVVNNKFQRAIALGLIKPD